MGGKRQVSVWIRKQRNDIHVCRGVMQDMASRDNPGPALKSSPHGGQRPEFLSSSGNGAGSRPRQSQNLPRMGGNHYPQPCRLKDVEPPCSEHSAWTPLDEPYGSRLDPISRFPVTSFACNSLKIDQASSMPHRSGGVGPLPAVRGQNPFPKLLATLLHCMPHLL